MLSWPEFEKNSCEIRKEISKTCRWGVGADYMQVVNNGQYLPLAKSVSRPKLTAREVAEMPDLT